MKYYSIQVRANDTPSISLLVKAESLNAAKRYAADVLTTVERADTDQVLAFVAAGGKIITVQEAA